jgi:hypothetical protein
MTADYWDQWFADIDTSELRQRLFTESLGLPPEVGPSNMVPLAGLHEITAALALSPDGVLADLACGRGGPGMWLAREVGARLLGVDVSAEAVIEEHADWHATAHAMWKTVMTVDPGDGPALMSLHAEGVRSLATHDHMRRVMATATAP